MTDLEVVLMSFTPQQRKAIENHCRLSIETMRPEFSWVVPTVGVSVVLTVNSGYE